MSSWSKRRKSIYIFVVLLLLIAAVIIPAYKIFYKPPTCSDGIKNGNEHGIDCGGSCERLCPSAFLAPNVAWSRFEQVSPGLFNIATYIINPNPDGQAKGVPYHVMLYDKQGVLITDVSDVVVIPPHRNTLAFMGAIPVGKRIPAKAVFEFTSALEWNKKSDTLSALRIMDKKYIEDNSGSSLQVTLRNDSVQDLQNISVYAILYDKNSNAIGFSNTIIDSIPANGDAIAPFTWPNDRNNGVVSIEVLPVSE